jgi:[acyl-carrier-protein] S-malonyltransferase
MKVAIFFPGQGAQVTGMGKELYDTNDVFRRMFDACDSASGIDLKKACFEGEGLENTSVIQPALYAVNVSTYMVLKSLGIDGNVFAGLSLGEYSALAASGAFSMAEATKLVAVRGRLMEDAVPTGVANMTAVIGLSPQEIEDAISDIDDVWVANMNSPAQIIIGGKLASLDVADVKVKEAGAKIVKRLGLSSAFHTPLLTDAGNSLRKELEKYDIIVPDRDVYANVTGDLYKKDDDIVDILSRQVYSNVHWSSIMLKVIDSVDVIIECGPGNVLSKLAKKQIKEAKSNVNVFSAESLKGIAEIEEYING